MGKSQDNQVEVSYVCRHCNHHSRKMLFQCPECKRWDTFEEVKSTSRERSTDVKHSLSIEEIKYSEESRIQTGFLEFDRVVGGALVLGSITLLSGFPGAGKSTLLLQVAQSLAASGKKVHIASGEESLSQVKMRANRVGATHKDILVLAETNMLNILREATKHQADVLIIDSLQSMYAGMQGDVANQKATANLLVNYAKNKDVPVILVGHITKEGEIAGPERVQHDVDTLLQFEGNKNSAYRVLRVVGKNRFGSDTEVGVFEMKEEGLIGVSNPANMYLIDREKDICGSVVTATMKGNRCLLVEIQAFVGASGSRKISCQGMDQSRLSMLISILEKSGLISTEGEIFVNVTGGFKLEETSVDLAVIMAILSSYKNQPLDQDFLVFGEVGLAGDVRGVSFSSHRVKEAEKVGFTKIIVPKVNELQINAKAKIFGTRKIVDSLDYLG